jgi:DNA-binding beta-propeller fold protein YncE
MVRAFRLITGLAVLLGTTASAHPGSGIAVDAHGQVFFTDTGKGVWKIDAQGELSYLPSSRFHWLAMDASGTFSRSRSSFGGFFESVAVSAADPALIQCSDFPLVIGTDGNIYYADTRPSSARIVRRTRDGTETVLLSDPLLEFVTGITAGPDGSIYFTQGNSAGSTAIRKIAADGKISTVARFAGKETKNPPLETTPSYCRGLAVDAGGSVYVAATGSRNILKIDPQGTVASIMETEGPWAPTGVAVHNGEVYVLEWRDPDDPAQGEVREAWLPRVRKTRQGWEGDHAGHRYPISPIMLIRIASGCAWFSGLGFGIPCIYGIWSLLQGRGIAA